MDDDQQFCLRWNNHQSTLISVFDTLLENETLVDCTLAAEGKFLKAHKVVLSACSPYFATLLQEQYDKHPIFILKDVKYQELRAMMDYMYRGEVNISQDQLTALLKAAESLQIKGLSDNRSGGGGPASAAAQQQQQQQQQQQAPKPDTHHRVKLSGQNTLEQTKRARITTGGGGGGAVMDAGDVSGSREGSSSPSRRRRKVRRRSMENDVHDNSNSSVQQAVVASNQSILQQTSLAASALVSTQLASGSGGAVASTISNSSGSSASQLSNQPLNSSSSNVTKKTESARQTSTAAAAQGSQQQHTTTDAINTDNVQQQQQQQQQKDQDAQVDADEMGMGGAVAVLTGGGGVVKQLSTLEKSNHKQKIKDSTSTTSITQAEMVIEPKAEYDDDVHDENVEDLTLDEEEMTMEELDQAAGTSQGGEGSSQAYATWQHDRSQDELGLMAAQDAQQRDPQDCKYEYGHSVFGSDMDNDRNSIGGDPHERFPCAVCGKSYLRKRHLQRHMRDECIGIPPRFNCEFCSSRFRRKYHMVRHLVSKHGIPPTIAQQTTGSGSRTSSPRNNNLELKHSIIGAVNGSSTGNGAQGGVVHSDSASVGSAGSHNGCESPIPENLSLRKEHYERDENLNDGSRGTSPLPPHMMPIPTYGLTGAITAISAAAAVVEEQAAAAAAAAAALAAAGNNNGSEGGASGGAGAAVLTAAELGIKAEPLTPSKAQQQPHHLLDEEWNMKLGLQIISNSLLKERLMNTMPFAYNNN